MCLSIQDTRFLTLGNSLFSTGGGRDIEIQNSLYQDLLQNNKLKLEDIKKLPEEDYICTVYSVGSSNKTKTNLKNSIEKGVKTLKEIINVKLAGVFSGEANAEISAFQTASILNLPVVDGDCCGGRAVPEIHFDNWFVKKISILPLVAVALDGSVLVIKEIGDVNNIEKIIRNLAIQSDGSVVVLDHFISVKEAKKVLTLNSISRAISTGRFIDENKQKSDFLKLLAKQIEAKIIFEGVVKQVNLEDKDGFLQGFYFIKNSLGDELKIYVKNENIIAWKNEKMIVSCPNLIMTFDIETNSGIHNSQICKNQKVAVFSKKATEIWQTKEGLDLFHSSKFGF